MRTDWRVNGLQRRLPGRDIRVEGIELYVDGVHIQDAIPLDQQWVSAPISDATDAEMLDGLTRYVLDYLSKHPGGR
jgi:hypothetical protein